MKNPNLKQQMESIAAQHGDWTYDIPLQNKLWTRGDLGIPHTRLKRLVQIAEDLSLKPLKECSVLDLGCLDGLFSIEFAKRGASVVGIDIREANIVKARFAQQALQLPRLRFEQDDVRNVSRERYGTFDVVLCSGLLYHLDARSALHLIENLHAIADRLVIIDSHISLSPNTAVSHNGKTYHGHVYREHRSRDSEQLKASRLLSSLGNDTSFWFSRPSLINCLSHAGFSSIYECFNPPHLNFGQPGQEATDRCTFVVIKGTKAAVETSPAADDLMEDWPEGTLQYCLPLRFRIAAWFRRNTINAAAFRHGASHSRA